MVQNLSWSTRAISVPLHRHFFHLYCNPRSFSFPLPQNYVLCPKAFVANPTINKYIIILVLSNSESFIYWTLIRSDVVLGPTYFTSCLKDTTGSNLNKGVQARISTGLSTYFHNSVSSILGFRRKLNGYIIAADDSPLAFCILAYFGTSTVLPQNAAIFSSIPMRRELFTILWVLCSYFVVGFSWGCGCTQS